MRVAVVEDTVEVDVDVELVVVFGAATGRISTLAATSSFDGVELVKSSSIV